jgi:hypothetical protein
MAQSSFSFGDFAVRWLGALALVMATFNPTPYSYFHWLVSDWPSDDLPIKALVGVVLLIFYVIFLRATLRSLGSLGLVLIVLLMAAILWVLIDYGWLDPSGQNAITWIVLVGVATILGVGMSWSYVRRRLTGQVDVDDVDEH